MARNGRTRAGRSWAATALTAALATAPGASQAETLSFLGAYEIPAGLKIEGVPFGGLSSLDHIGEGFFLAISDDRASRGPARFYLLGIELTRDGVVGLDISAMIPLTDLSGQPYAERMVDPEGLRRAGPDRLYWVSEGPGGPSLTEASAAGRATALFPTPEHHIPDAEGAAATRGVRRNRAYESVTVDAEGRVVVATEDALRQDGPEAGLTAGARVRVAFFDPQTRALVSERLYQTDPIAAAPSRPDAFAANGLVELLGRPEGGFYALERSFTEDVGTTVKLYATEIEGATEVVDAPAAPADAAPMPKRLLLTLTDGDPAPRIDNLEGLSFGPEIDGARTLLLISDDNFNPGQTTQILVYRLAP